MDNEMLTLIIGAKCRDGVILLSDSRISRGNDLNQYPKIFKPIDNTFVGAAGTTGIFYKFLKQINAKVQSGEIKDWEQLLEVVEDLVLQLSTRYYRRTGGDPIDVLMGMKNQEKHAELHHITPAGVSEEVLTTMAIGHGEPYASLFLKTMWTPKMTMRETAILGAFILAIIDELGLDSSVDDQLQVGYLPYEGDQHQATQEELETIEDESDILCKDFLKKIDQFTLTVKHLKPQN